MRKSGSCQWPRGFKATSTAAKTSSWQVEPKDEDVFCILTSMEDDNGSEWDLKVRFTYAPFRKGDTGEHGEPLEPNEDESVEIVAVYRKEPVRDQDDLQWIDFDCGGDEVRLKKECLAKFLDDDTRSA
jgi:hypothetical protein